MTAWWRAGSIDVCGPYRDEKGRVHAVSAIEQRAWAESLGGRLPTPAEADQIWLHACVRVPPQPRDVAAARLWALDDDVRRALDGRSSQIRIAAGKTWVQHSQTSAARATNYGWHVPASEVDRARSTWRRIRVYPCSISEAYVIQPAAQAHHPGHVDYSQLGYAVRAERDIKPDDDPDTQPTPTSPGQRGPGVEAWQRWLLAWDPGALPRFGADGDHGGETEEWTQRWRAAQPDAVVSLSEPALPMAPFRQAVSCYHGRRNGPPIWVVIHTAEALEHSETAENLQAWAASEPVGVSWHYAVDNDTIAPSVHEEHTACAAPGANARGIQIELAGYARQTPEQWRDAFSTAQLQLCARLVAEICRRWKIPVRRVGPDEMLGGLSGICGHADVTAGVGKGRTTHPDPGKWFPWEDFLTAVRAAAEEM